MEIIKKGNCITIKKKLSSKETYKINKTSKFESISFYKKPRLVYGMASSTDDGKDVLFIDYDNTDISVVLLDYRLIQERFSLPQAYLFKSSENSFHTICLKKFLPHEVYKVLVHTHTDSAYMNMPLRNKYKNWVLRIGEKGDKCRPEFVMIIGEDKKYCGEVSNAHLEFLSKLYPKIKHPSYYSRDNGKNIKLQEYET